MRSGGATSSIQLNCTVFKLRCADLAYGSTDLVQGKRSFFVRKDHPGAKTLYEFLCLHSITAAYPRFMRIFSYIFHQNSIERCYSRAELNGIRMQS